MNKKKFLLGAICSCLGSIAFLNSIDVEEQKDDKKEILQGKECHYSDCDARKIQYLKKLLDCGNPNIGTKGCPGPAGPQGAQGSQTSVAGPTGPTGPTGATGATGSSTIIVLPFQRDLFVNKEYTDSVQNGSLANPYTTIQAAVNDVISRGSDASNSQLGYSINIASGDYSSEGPIVISNDNKRIKLVGLGRVVISGLQWNIPTLAGTAGTISVSIESTDTVFRRATSPDFFATTANIDIGFIVAGNVTINAVAGIQSFFTKLQINGVVQGAISINSSSSLMSLYFKNSVINQQIGSPVSGSVAPAVGSQQFQLLYAENTIFQGQVGCETYGTIRDCTFLQGLQITSNLVIAIGFSPPLGMMNSNFTGQFLGPVGTNFILDPVTNYWFRMQGTIAGGATTLLLNPP